MNDNGNYCDGSIGSNAQRLICSYNTIRGSHRGETTNPLAMSQSNLNYVMTGNANPRRESWRVYDDVEISICNGKKFRGVLFYSQKNLITMQLES